MPYSKHATVVQALAQVVKKSSFRQAFGEVVKSPAFLAGMAPMVLGGGAAAAHAVVERIGAARDRAQAYSTMLQLHPELKQEDPKTVQRYYSTLHRFNPTMATDPTVAGAWMSQVINAEKDLPTNQRGAGVLHSIKDLAGIRSSLGQASRSENGPGWGPAVAEHAKFIPKAQESVEKVHEKAIDHAREDRRDTHKDVIKEYKAEFARHGIKPP